MIDNKHLTIERPLNGVLDGPFVRLPYTEGIKILRTKNKAISSSSCILGCDLASEHESVSLLNSISKKPVILTDYPKETKASI